MVTVAGASVQDAIFSPDGDYLYVASGGSITVYSTSTGQNLTSWTIGSQLGAFDVSIDGRYIVAVERTPGPTTGTQWDTQTDYYVYRLDTLTGAVQTYTHHETGYDGPFADISYLADGTVLLTQNFHGSGWVPLTTLDLATGVFTASPGAYSQDGTLNATPDDRFVAFTPHNISDAPIFYYTSGTGVTASHQGYADGVSGYNSGVQAISPDGSLVAEGIGLNVYNANLQLQFSLATLYPELQSTIALAFSADGDTFYMVNSARSTVYALSTADWSLTAGYAVDVTLGGVNPYGDGITTSSDGRYISIIGSDGVEIIDLSTAPSVPGTGAGDALTNDSTPFVYGYGGNDVISVTGDVDVVRAGAGSDRVNITAPASSGGTSYNIIDGGSGNDTLDVSALTAPAFTSAGAGFLVTAGGGKSFTVSSIEIVQLGSGNDSFTMASNGSTLQVRGGGGDDTFQGGLRMVLRGEGGSDTFMLSGSGGPATNGLIDGGAGTDRIQLSAGFSANLSAGTADSGSAHFALLGIEDVTVTVGGLASQITGDGNANRMAVNAYLDNGAAGVTFNGLGGDDVLTGSAGVDSLNGGDGHDILDGRVGNDTMTGGIGNDTYYIDGLGDTIVELAGQGTDTLAVGFSHALASGSTIENLATTDTAATTAINLTGNAGINAITGNNGSNVLNGGAGADTLNGLGGNDFFFVDNAADVIVEAAGGGSDRVYASVSYVLGAAAQVEILSTTDNAGTNAINFTGNGFANSIAGNNGSNILNGGAGADTLNGLGGNDLLFVDNAGDVIVEAAGGGSDRVYASVSYALGAGAQVEILSTTENAGTDAINLTGNGFANSIAGNNGVNVLNGGGGADTLNGFGGNDFFYVDNAADVVIEAAGGGSDRVFASVSYALGAAAQVEILSTTNNAGVGAINLTGNGFANSIGGNAGANVLDGLGGNDTLNGLGGADTFRFTTALGAGNVDTITGYSVADDKIEIDNAVFTGLAAGALAAGAFNTGAAATQADDRIIYNSATGALLFDADGNGAGSAVQFAALSAGLGMTAGEFMVI